ncbi:Ig-like domain-containing protein [Galbibacter sp. PAP.153]|uniref:Ig-like domain-containing protein n=1 Tax=Galbibacter sp. PAP.153 TaxID=3104623 RepID=UPI00300989EA
MKHQNRHIKQLVLGLLLLVGYQVSAQFVLQAPESNPEDGTISNYHWYVLDGESKTELGSDPTQQVFIPGVYFATYDGTKCGKNATSYFIVTYCNEPKNSVTLNIENSVSANASVSWNQGIANGNLNPSVTATKDIEEYIATVTKAGYSKKLPTFKVVCLQEEFELVDDVVAEVATAGTEINMLDNDVAIPSIGMITFSSPSNGSVSIDKNGTPMDPSDDILIYVPGTDFNGVDSFTYTLTLTNSDNTEMTDTATISINAMLAQSDALVVEEDSGSGPSNQIDVSLNDNIGSLGGDDNNYQLTANASHGVVIEIVDGVFEYVPNADFNGMDSFTYALIDHNGNSVEANVSVEVTPVNDAPIAENDTFNSISNTESTLDIIYNDRDIDGDELSVQSYTDPQHGILSEENGKLIYYPDLDFVGQDTFTYVITDGNEISNTAEVIINIKPGTRSIVLIDDEVTTNEDEPVVINVLGNDTIASDVNYTLSATDNKGTSLKVRKDYTVEYTPEPDFVGTVVFEYTITYTGAEGVVYDFPARVTVIVLPVKDVQDDYADVDSSNQEEVIIPIFNNDTFNPNTTLVIAAISNPVNGTVTVNADNTLSYIVDPSFEGQDIFSYTVRVMHSDGVTWNEEQGMVTVNAQPINPPPPPPVEDELKVHQLVSPNDDGQNDVLKIYGIEDFPENSVKIFNRWGVMVYETTGYGQGNNFFRGYSEGRVSVQQKDKLPVGTYYYVIDYIVDQNTKNMAGYFYINY